MSKCFSEEYTFTILENSGGCSESIINYVCTTANSKYISIPLFLTIFLVKSLFYHDAVLYKIFTFNCKINYFYLQYWVLIEFIITFTRIISNATLIFSSFALIGVKNRREKPWNTIGFNFPDLYFKSPCHFQMTSF